MGTRRPDSRSGAPSSLCATWAARGGRRDGAGGRPGRRETSLPRGAPLLLAERGPGVGWGRSEAPGWWEARGWEGPGSGAAPGGPHWLGGGPQGAPVAGGLRGSPGARGPPRSSGGRCAGERTAGGCGDHPGVPAPQPGPSARSSPGRGCLGPDQTPHRSGLPGTRAASLGVFTPLDGTWSGERGWARGWGLGARWVRAPRGGAAAARLVPSGSWHWHPDIRARRPPRAARAPCDRPGVRGPGSGPALRKAAALHPREDGSLGVPVRTHVSISRARGGQGCEVLTGRRDTGSARRSELWGSWARVGFADLPSIPPKPGRFARNPAPGLAPQRPARRVLRASWSRAQDCHQV